MGEKKRGRKANDTTEEIVKATVGLTQKQWDFIATHEGGGYSAQLRAVLDKVMGAATAPLLLTAKKPTKTELARAAKPKLTPRQARLKELGWTDMGTHFIDKEGLKVSVRREIAAHIPDE